MSDDPALFLGFDLGGTHTRCVATLATGRIVGRGGAGPGHPRAVGTDGALHAIARARGQALAVYGSKPEPAASAGLGVAGLGTAEERREFAHALGPLRLAAPGGIVVDHDLAAAWCGAFGSEAGAILVAGTGSAAFAQREDGSRARAGGLGAILDDAGSATAIGLAALRRLVRESDGREDSSELGRTLRRELALAEIRGVLRIAGADRLDRPAVAALAPRVAALAERGCPVARAIVEGAAAELAALARAVAPERGEIALEGGAISAPGPLRTALESALRADGFAPVDPLLDPTLGALLLARPAPERRDLAEAIARDLENTAP
ncbi:MAG: BadF/BadG/BcrA/BcrD ATPase family protein [Planctomycetota bacterium]